MPKPKHPGAKMFVSMKGDLSAKPAKLTPYDLMQQLEIMNIPTASKMGEAINVDMEELWAVLDKLAAAIPRDKYETTRQSLRGVLAWGVAIGYFYAKQNKPVVVQ